MPGQTERIAGKNFDAPDEQRRPFERGKIDVITVGGLTFHGETLEPSAAIFGVVSSHPYTRGGANSLAS